VNKVVYGTCLATDMSGFTTISESKSPDELANFMNAYFEALAKVLKDYAVDVTEFHADTIMCAWTADQASATVRRKAVLAAIETVVAIDRFSEEQGSLGLKPRIGLQDGSFYLGHTGGGGRFSFSILGDPANTAARLESLNKHLGTRLLASQSVVEGIHDILCRPLGSFRLVGRTTITSVVEIVERRHRASADQIDLCVRFAQALDLFTDMRWGDALDRFEDILRDHPSDGPTRLYMAQCRMHSNGVPTDVDPTLIAMDVK
jgi:adenylate cyclase